MHNTNINLFGYENYFNKLNTLLDKNLLPNSILISGFSGIGKSTFLSHFLTFQKLNTGQKQKYLNTFCFDSYDLIEKLLNNHYANIKIIKKETVSQYVNIDQVRTIDKFCSLQSFNNEKRFVYIANIEDLNINASTALLKILEKSNKNIFFLLERNSQHNVLDTIASRCLNFNISFDYDKLNNISKNLLKNFQISSLNSDLLFNKFDTPGSKLEKILYLSQNKIIDLNIKDIIIFCLNDYNKNKNYQCIKYAIELSINLFFNNSLLKTYSLKNCYYEFIKYLQLSLRYNLDINPAINIIRELKN